jgi:CheY-like chemotaxis protein
MSNLGLENQDIALASVQSEKSAITADGGLCRRTSILVIDDDRQILRVLERALSKQGFAVRCAAAGDDAIDLYRRFGSQIDIVLSDLNMPVMDGPTTLDALKKINPFICFCFMTGDTSKSTIAELLQRGAMRVFAKPFSSVAYIAEELREMAARRPVLEHAGN